MTRQNGVDKQAYISPAMEVVSIEMEQSILAGSNQGQVETIGVTKDEMEWGNSRRGDSWGNLWD